MTARMSLRAIAAIALTVAGGLGYLLIESTNARSASEPTSASEQAVISHVAAFQRSLEAGDTVPGETVLSGITRSIGDPTIGHHIWASVSPNELCVQLGQEGASACIPPGEFGEKALIVGAGSRPPASPGPLSSHRRLPPSELAGVAPNGMTSVTVHFDDGTSKTVPVVDNGFYINATGHPSYFEWTTANGAVHRGPETASGAPEGSNGPSSTGEEGA